MRCRLEGRRVGTGSVEFWSLYVKLLARMNQCSCIQWQSTTRDIRASATVSLVLTLG